MHPTKCNFLQLGCSKMRINILLLIMQGWYHSQSMKEEGLLIKKGNCRKKTNGLGGWQLVLMRERKHCASLITKYCATDIATASVCINTIAHISRITNSTKFNKKKNFERLWLEQRHGLSNGAETHATSPLALQVAGCKCAENIRTNFIRKKNPKDYMKCFAHLSFSLPPHWCQHLVTICHISHSMP